MSLIKINNLTIGYDNCVLINNLTLEINKGNYLCIVGENGAGKSTFMKTLLGLQEKISGDIIYGDELVQNEIGYLPQQTDVQRDFPASVKEIVYSGCQARLGFRPFYNSKEKAFALENMKRMGIENLQNRCYRELSGGQQQRVLLARALCAASKLLLLDEPVAGLDPKVTAEMYELIKKLNDSGITIIMISHDMSAAIEYASHILHIGNKIFFGTKEEYIRGDIAGSFFYD